jgi:hypothetical protein
MQQHDACELNSDISTQSRGNTFSGFVALALLAMFALALVSSELESGGNGAAAPITTVIAGQ